MNINQQVIHMKDKAEKAALKGEYKQALSLLKEATNLRPTYTVLQNDQKQIQKALGLDKSLDDITASLKKQELEKADSKISKVQRFSEKPKRSSFFPFSKTNRR